MLYEVITVADVAIESFMNSISHKTVITSYSIHYTKLYDLMNMAP